MSKKKYIDYGKLLEERYRLGLDEMSRISKVNAFNHFIDTMPIADVEEVQHGKWINHSGGEWGCSSCANIVFTEGSWETPYDNYCPYCGAKMDKEQE